MFLFDFNQLIERLKNNENKDKKEIVEKYEENFGPITGDLKDQIWYKEYVSKFQPIEYTVPSASREDFDYVLLAQLAASSFSSEVALDIGEDSLPDFVISVENGGQSIAKKVNELFGYQIDRLFKIYCEEQMNLQNHIHENEQEKEEILAQREYKLKQWKLRIDHFSAKKEQEQEQAARSGKLDNLMGQL